MTFSLLADQGITQLLQGNPLACDHLVVISSASKSMHKLTIVLCECSLQELLIHIDHALQYGEDLEVNTRKMDQDMEENDD